MQNWAGAMSMNRRFHGETVRRLIVSVPEEVVNAVDELLRQRSWGCRHPARGCRSEFVRMAILEKLARDTELKIST
jgi:metal-responsive CopG/Arc/MetJ family transcriptional regulator